MNLRRNSLRGTVRYAEELAEHIERKTRFEKESDEDDIKDPPQTYQTTSLQRRQSRSRKSTGTATTTGSGVTAIRFGRSTRPQSSPRAETDREHSASSSIFDVVTPTPRRSLSGTPTQRLPTPGVVRNFTVRRRILHYVGSIFVPVSALAYSIAIGSGISGVVRHSTNATRQNDPYRVDHRIDCLRKQLAEVINKLLTNTEFVYRDAVG